MSDHTDSFIAHLEALQARDRGALAALRHSLAFAPGSYPRAYPYVERFAGHAAHERDARRLALYAVAGLFALHPQQAARSLGSALGELYRDGSGSIEGRFIALLGADAENIVEYLRQAISLLAAKSIGLDYGRLLDDLTQWMNPGNDPGRLRQRWARDFYRAAQPTPDAPLETA
ncbi:type I-E CRISPR-associated protein Cse2/CasB [Metapseudomonas otitidis]|nr:type I-E CRISPR-associated protein Cse2/CasB [Pseudomonas otitidis]MDG9784280.1 type I-E CRISPR-associated protein Cse2/CasB [Pseudomonas otitidis]